MTIHLHRNDLPDGLDLGPVVAIDTETMGLDPRRDRLCLVQLSAGDGDAHLVQIAPGPGGGIGRRAGFRYQCRKAWRFESSPGHQTTMKAMQPRQVAWLCRLPPSEAGPPIPPAGCLLRHRRVRCWIGNNPGAA